MAKGQIQYTVQGGDLPIGVTMDPATGKLVGNLSPENVGQGPIWSSPAADTTLATTNVGDTISLEPMTVSPREGRPVSGLAVVGNKPLPWGLAINPKTGVISGKVGEFKGSQIADNSNVNPPQWTTQFGSQGSFSETATVNLTLAASGQKSKTIRSYLVVSGGLPWGIVLNPRTGAITGTTQEIKTPGFDLGLSPSVLTPPRWTTGPGTLKVFDENDTTTTSTQLTLVAAAQAGKTMSSYRVINGALPWGFTLDSKTGIIGGTASEIKLVTDPIFYERTKDPLLTNTFAVNGQNLTQTGDNVNLGSFAKGTIINAQLNIVPYAGRTARLHISNGNLPFGLTIDPTGKISGTIGATKYVQSGIYNFTIRVVDNVQAYSLRSYSITVQ
jgi:hypothetical protein